MTHLFSHPPRWLLGSSLIVFSLVACFALTLTLGWLRDRQAGDYPGARTLSAHTDFGLLPLPYYRLNTSYRSGDTFPQIVNWYQERLGVGQETQAQGGCSHLLGSSHRLLFSQSASVTVCETTRGRLIFVQRATTLALP